MSSRWPASIALRWPWMLRVGSVRLASAGSWLFVALLLLLGLLTYFASASHRQVRDSAALTTRNLVQVIESSLTDDFSRIDGILNFAAAEIGESGLSPDLSASDHARVRRRLERLRQSFPKLSELRVFDADGRLLHSSDSDGASAFSGLLDAPFPSLAPAGATALKSTFSDVRFSRTTDGRAIVQSRAIHDENGQVVGRVSALFDLGEIEALFRRIDVGPGGVALLRRSDDSTLVQRYPPLNEADFDQPLPASNPIRQRVDAGEQSGTLTYTATTDGVERIGSFDVLDGFPFYAQVSLSAEHYLAGWRAEVRRLMAIGVLFAIGFGFAIARLVRDDRRFVRIAQFDSLTGLPNRALLSDRLEQAMYRANRNGGQIAVAYLDLDGFKVVNDVHGHDIGDRLLVTLAARMKDCVREGDTVARLGGDEFVVVFCDLESTALCIGLVRRLITEIDRPVIVDGRDLHVSSSIGVTFYPQRETVEAEQLLRQADQAMYQAKLGGKNGFHLFDVEHDQLLRGHHEQLDRIGRAIERAEFVLHYQPKVHMRTGAVIGVEALIRWQHPELGLLAPARFLPAIERHRLDVDLSIWVLDTALRQMRAWERSGLVLPVSVNVSAHFLQHADFLPELEALLQRHAGLPAGRLELEVLESSALSDIDSASEVIRACNRLGVGIALDDFGTGYSSLSYLKRLPVRQLKVDQSFVRDMLHDPEDLAILEGILGLARAFRREVIAEGVETLAHGRALLQLGCNLAQGYGIARPMPAVEVPEWIAHWRPHREWVQARVLEPDDVPLLHAGVELSAWLNALEAGLSGSAGVPRTQETGSCRCGEWLAKARERNAADPHYRETCTLHAQIHELARGVISSRHFGDPARIEPALAELRACRDRMLDALQALIAQRVPVD